MSAIATAPPPLLVDPGDITGERLDEIVPHGIGLTVARHVKLHLRIVAVPADEFEAGRYGAAA